MERFSPTKSVSRRNSSARLQSRRSARRRRLLRSPSMVVFLRSGSAKSAKPRRTRRTRKTRILLPSLLRSPRRATNQLTVANPKRATNQLTAANPKRATNLSAVRRVASLPTAERARTKTLRLLLKM